MLTAKGLGSGMPIGAIIAPEEITTWKKGAHGSTFGGNPVCCAAAIATLDLIEGGLMNNARMMGDRLMAGFRRLAEKYSSIGDVRGLGLMIGLEFVKDRRTREPEPEWLDSWCWTRFSADSCSWARGRARCASRRRS